MEPLRSLLLFLGLAVFTWASAETTIPAETTASPCPRSYYHVSDRCVLVNPFVEGTWDEGRYYCDTLDGSNYVEIDSIQFFYDLLNFLRYEDLDQHSYWLGARDVEEEGTWKWEVGGGLVPMGSPFWAIEFDYGDEYDIEPLGRNYSNCLRLDHHRYHYLDDADCDSSLISFMCQKPLLL